MTRSEMHAVMTSGMATVAGSTLGAYINFGVKASHLLCASIMSAPAALAMSKVGEGMEEDEEEKEEEEEEEEDL